MSDKGGNLNPNILHIAHISNNLASGPMYSIPNLVLALHDLGISTALYTTASDGPFTRKQPYPVFYYRDYGRIPTISVLPRPFNRPDLIVFHDVYVLSHIFLSFRVHRMGIPYVMTPRGGMTEGAQRMKRRKKQIGNFLFFNRMVKHAEAIHCLTRNEARDAERWGRPVFVAGNGVNLPEFNPRIQDKVGLNFVFIGRLDIHHKGLDLLLEACVLVQDILRRERVQIHLYGPERAGSRAKITEFIDAHAIGDIVFLHEPVYGDEKQQILAHADVFLHLSRFEGHPMAVLEALAHGIPCLLTPGTNLAEEVAAAGAGWYTAPDAASIAASLESILERQSELPAIGQRARRLAATQYSWKSIAECLLEAYMNLDVFQR